jgi:hypothetical protein
MSSYVSVTTSPVGKVKKKEGKVVPVLNELITMP